MLKNLFSKNPLLKILLPLLLVAFIGLLFIRLIKPQLVYREELEAKAAALSQELNNITKVAANLSVTDKNLLEQQLKTMRENLGLSLYSPELVQLLEERAGQTRIHIQSYSFEETGTTNGLQERKLKLVIKGNFNAILDFQKSLEEFPPFTGTKAITIRPFGTEPKERTNNPNQTDIIPPGVIGPLVPQYNGEDLEAELSLSFSCVPEALEKVESRDLPVREHPFR